MNILTVDIGTNTVLALFARADGGRLLRVHDDVEIVRLGEGLDRSGRLSEAAMGRALVALSRIGERARTERPEGALAIATEAVRKAENGEAFLARARQALGFPVEAIDGEREARLSWVATARSLPPPPPQAKGRRTVLDIGGGSTELILGGAHEDHAEHAVSVPIGSVRLTERILHHDPPRDDERRLLVETVDRALDGAPPPEGDLVGIAGTVTTLCAIHLGLSSYDAERVHATRMARADVERVVERLGTLPLDERRRLPGLDPRRADVIYAGGVILTRVMARARVPELLVSDRGIRWGLAYEIAERALGGRFQ